MDYRAFQDYEVKFRADIPQSDVPASLPSRPAQPNNQGRETIIQLNTFNVLQYPTKKVYQYDVSITQFNKPVDQAKRSFIRKLWMSKAVQSKTGKGWLYDGNKLAW